MKKIIFTAVLSLLLMLFHLNLQAQRYVVEGSCMNIGIGNTIDNGGRVDGNAIGYHNAVFSNYALAVGQNDTVENNSSGSMVMGVSNYVRGTASLGFGRCVRLLRNDNIGIGRHLVVNGLRGGMAIGSGVEGNGGAAAYLVNDSSNCLMIGFNSIRPTLFVSESPNNYSQGLLDKTGRVAIGDVMPGAKLHIRSDEGENAGIILEPGDPTSDSVFVHFGDANHRITVTPHGDMEISTGYNRMLDINAWNFKVSGNLIGMGMSGTHAFTICTDYTPSIGLNARQSNGQYQRSGNEGSSYAIEFSDGAFKLRTAEFMLPRYDLITNWVDALVVGTNGTVTLNGKVGVNVENSTQDYALAVDGGVLTTKVHIQDVADWQDRVFGEDYALMPLGEVEAYVTAHRHLPGIPSEAEVKTNGYDVAEMHSLLLGKIEELTLYMVRQQHEIDSLRTLVTVRFDYDDCGNRTSRTLEFSRCDEGRGTTPGGVSEEVASNGARWLASISDRFAGGDAMLFPNPTEDGFFLSLAGSDIPEGTTASLCTVDGRVLEERTVAGPTETFDLHNQPAGVYLLRLCSEREAKVWKVIKRN